MDTSKMGIGSSKEEPTVDLGPYATKTDVETQLSPYATKSDLESRLLPYATKSDMESQLSPYALKTDVETKVTELSSTFASKDQINQTVQDLATKEQVTNWLLPFQTQKNPYYDSPYKNRFVEYPGMDLTGSDMWSKKDVTRDQCRQICESNTRCAAYAFNTLTATDTKGTCWPKRMQPNDNIIEAGVKLGANEFVTYRYADWPGNDIPNGSILNSSPAQCLESCKANANCTHYSYIMPDTCVLKNLIKETTPGTRFTAFRS